MYLLFFQSLKGSTQWFIFNLAIIRWESKCIICLNNGNESSGIAHDSRTTRYFLVLVVRGPHTLQDRADAPFPGKPGKVRERRKCIFCPQDRSGTRGRLLKMQRGRAICFRAEREGVIKRRKAWTQSCVMDSRHQPREERSERNLAVAKAPRIFRRAAF